MKIKAKLFLLKTTTFVSVVGVDLITFVGFGILHIFG